MQPSSPGRRAPSAKKLDSISTVAARHKALVYVSAESVNEKEAVRLVQVGVSSVHLMMSIFPLL
jgi:hypothetical protein